MPAYLKLGDIKGEAQDQGHKEWITMKSMTSPVHRSIPQGALAQQRTKGGTVLGDILVTRDLDKSSVKLQEACANGTFFKEVQIDFCTTVKNKQEPYLTYKLKDVIVTSYSFHGVSDQAQPPTEDVTFNFTEIEWTYVVIDPQSGDKKGTVIGKYNPGTGKS